jgi:3',5'-cyclic AMP phosphodiesterase CpdA
MHPMLRTRLVVAFSAFGSGCDFYPEDAAAEPTLTGEVCDPAVMVPVGPLTGSESVPAQAHSEVFGTSPEPYAVRYNWPSRDPSRNAAFLWRTDTDTLASQVQIGPADGFPDNATTIDGYTFLFGGVDVDTGDYRIHEVRICGDLEPETTYSYRVGGEGHWSKTYTITTPGAPGSFDTFRVAISGDSRGAYDTWGQLLRKMDAAEPDFFLFSGDMVEIGPAQSEWDAWFAAGEDILAERAFVPAHGNHEMLAVHYFAQFALPSDHEQYFALDYGNLLVLSLNDTVADQGLRDVEERNFIEAELRDTAAQWKVAMHHQPAYSTCTNHHSNLNVREAWSDVFESFGVNLVLAGHNHIYERSLPIKNGAEQNPGEGTVYLVSGGAGAPLYTNSEEQWFGDVAKPVEHYVIADFSPSGIDVVAYDLSGNVIDSFTIPRP